MPSSAALQTPSAVDVELLTPGKRRTAIQRKKSETEELKRALRGQEESTRRKQAISDSLGKWESTAETSTSRRRSSMSSRKSGGGRRAEESFWILMEEPST